MGLTMETSQREPVCGGEGTGKRRAGGLLLGLVSSERGGHGDRSRGSAGLPGAQGQGRLPRGWDAAWPSRAKGCDERRETT